MNRLPRVLQIRRFRCLLAPFAVVVGLGCGYPARIATATSIASGNRWDPERAIFFTEPWPPNGHNGIAYDKAYLDLAKIPGLPHDCVIVVPEKAVVESNNPLRGVSLFMAKELGYVGHPPKDIAVERKQMGCVWRIEKGRLVIATYGEWDSRIEGRTELLLLSRIPEGHKVERRTGLAGAIVWPDARQEGMTSREPTDPGSHGWHAVPDQPDAERTARRKQDR